MNKSDVLREDPWSKLGKAKGRMLVFAVCRQRQKSNLRGYGEGRSDRSHGKGAGDFA
jgi:hypothetical protein